MERLENRMQREFEEALRESGVSAGAPAQVPDQQPQPAPAQASQTPAAPQQAPAAPAQSQQTPIPPPDELGLLRHQFDTLRGKYNAEVPRLHQLLKERDATIAELRQTIASTPPAPAAPAGGNGAHPPAFQAAYDAVRDEWGDKAADSFAAMARSLSSEMAAQVEQRFAQKVQPVEQSVQDLAVQRYHDSISLACGTDWMTLNDDPAFVGWLDANAEPGTGLSLRQALNNAYRDGNVNAVAFFFNTFKELRARQPAQQPQAAPQPMAPNTPRLTPEQQAMMSPTNRQVGSFQNQADSASGKVYTEREAFKLYDDLGKGRFDHDPKLKRSLEADLDRAHLEGRVVPG